MSADRARVLMLRAELQRDWDMVVAHRDRAVSADPAESPANAAFVALSLDHAYQAFETLLIRVERSLGLPERGGGQWHRTVLADAAIEVPGMRPAVVPSESESRWDEVRRFRHFLRHAYTVELDPARLARVVVLLREAVDLSDASVSALIASLEPATPVP